MIRGNKKNMSKENTVEVNDETLEKINLLFSTNPEMKDRLCNWDVEAIREIGSISQRGINPDDVVAAYESGNRDTMDYLYQQAKRLVVLQELYKDLCFEYYKKSKVTSELREDESGHKINLKN